MFMVILLGWIIGIITQTFSCNEKVLFYKPNTDVLADVLLYKRRVS